MLCQHFLSGLCPLPPVSPLNLTSWFAKPKPNPLPPPKKPSGKRLKVLHLSDVHIDPRTSQRVLCSARAHRPVGYDTGSEANCTSGLCCRSNGFNTQSPNVSLSPAPRYGAFHWYGPPQVESTRTHRDSFIATRLSLLSWRAFSPFPSSLAPKALGLILLSIPETWSLTIRITS